jgi:hypothetical protein
MAKMLKKVKYYPLKIKGGFVIRKTRVKESKLGFATFKAKKVAIASGYRWYGGKLRKQRR